MRRYGMNLTAALVGLTLAFGTAAQAQDRVDQLLPAEKPAPGEVDRQASDAEQDPAEVRTTQALNAEITARNDLAESQERADQAAFEAERARWEQQQALNNQARLDWEASVRASEEARQRWEADRARWEADVRACEAGDLSRCAAPK
ncbi:cell wall hydrolase [Brevundimonas bacteroides]|uniref:cell wall hydrolase n=1 Tax=Brevundimonas bacteroides TaxID=74311 RepID=UPI0012EDB450|nr:cell wall hydrolase [Brevundimonas bacteroides]